MGRFGRSLTRAAPVLAFAVVVALATYLALPRLLHREIAYYDEGVYVATAKALAAGSGYRNPSLPDAPPQAKYPPLFPLALSFVWRLAPRFPANLIAISTSPDRPRASTCRANIRSTPKSFAIAVRSELSMRR